MLTNDNVTDHPETTMKYRKIAALINGSKIKNAMVNGNIKIIYGSDERKIIGAIDELNFAIEDTGDRFIKVKGSVLLRSFSELLIVSNVGMVKIRILIKKNSPLRLLTNSCDLKSPFH